MKKKVVVLIFVLPFSVLFAQSPVDSLKKWTIGGVGALNFSQITLNNWAAGGENSFSTTALFNLFSNYKKNKLTWDNSFDFAYGFLQRGTSALRKSDDKIDITSKLGYETKKNWYATALVNFKSQFSVGYNYPNDSTVISNFLAPAYTLISTGMDYKVKDYFSFFASPITGKITVVNSQSLADVGAYGVEKAVYNSAGIMTAKGKMSRYEFGALISTKFKKEIVKNVILATKLDLFSNYLHDPQNIDVNWDFLLNLKVNKYIATSISTTLIYDHDTPIGIYKNVNGVSTLVGTGPRTQFKEALAVGFSYKF